MSTKLTAEQKQANKEARKEARKLANETARIEADKNQKPVKAIDMSIEWVKSRMWGHNPIMTARVQFADGSWDRFETSCSGCGYDKESTVIAVVYNAFLKYTLFLPLFEFNKQSIDRNGIPYGMYVNDKYKRFEGGIGTECYYAISQAIGGTFTKVASGKTFDAFRFEMKPTDTK